MNPVVHFELPAEDKERMKEFYTSVFGWKAHQMGPEMGNYVVVQTSETDEHGMIKTPGMINGGFFEKTKEHRDPTIVISVDDIYAHMEKVRIAGGTVLGGMKPGQPDDIPGVGLYAAIMDSEGNRIGMLQPKRMETK